MPPLANEAEHAAYWARQPMPPRAAWLDQYATLLGRARPNMTPDEAYAAAEIAFARESFCHPRLAVACYLTLGPLSS